MNGFYKVKGTWDTNEEKHYGVVVGENEAELMSKVIEYYGRENVERVSFWFGEFYDCDVIEVEDFKGCPLFDFSKKS